MTQEALESAKSELVGLMSNGEHCDESIEQVKKIKCLSDFINVLNLNVNGLRHKNFPPYIFMKKWSSDDLDELNRNGIFIDQVCECGQMKERCIFLFGCSKITVNISEIKTQFISCYDNSRVILNMKDCTLAYVYLHGNSDVIFDEQGRYVKLKKVYC